MFRVGFVTWYHAASLERRLRFPDGTLDGFHYVANLKLVPEYSGYRFRSEEEARYGFIEKEETFRPEPVESSTLIHKDDYLKPNILANFVQRMASEASTKLWMMNVKGQLVSDRLTRLALYRKVEFCARRALSLPPEDFQTIDQVIEVQDFDYSQDQEYKRLQRRKEKARKRDPEFLAQQLLKELVSQEDFERYCTRGYFYLPSSSGYFKYKIPKYGNVAVIVGDKAVNSL